MSLIDELTEQLARFPTDQRINLTNNTTNMAVPQISVRDYLELIPTFDGNPTKLSTFLEACEEVFPLMAPGNEPNRLYFTMLHIKTKLVGKAAALIAARNIRTFPELKETLINLFGDQRNEESLLSDLNTLRQKPNETPHQFADHCINIRCLLLSKLSCSNVQQVVKDTKLTMYNNFTLRAFLTGVNPQLSHLLRCRNPKNIEEAIQMVTEEENLNYHRSKIGVPSSSQNNKPNYQLRINPPQTRQQFSPMQNQAQFKKYQPQQPQQKWIPKPFPVKHPYFQQQNNFPRQQLPGPSQQKPYHPTPMEVDSNRTRLTRQTFRPNQPKFKIEEVTTQEVENSENYDEYYYHPEDYEESQDNTFTNGQENENSDTDVNFQTPASDSEYPIRTNTNQ